MKNKKKKLYCFADETGQDAGSSVFIVVTIVIVADINGVRDRLEKLETDVRIGKTKWHKSNYKFRIKFIAGFLSQNNKDLRIYFMKTRKPILYYAPTLEILQKAIAENSGSSTQSIVCIDGLDKFTAKKFTNALRSKNLKVTLAKGVRDESEVLIRLADRWAGCIRMSSSGNKECIGLLKIAERKDVIFEL